MINLLIQYFIKNGHISLPGIGTLHLTKNESFWDNGKLIAPNEQIILDHKSIDQNITLLNYLAYELDISLEEANAQFTIFLESILSQQVASINFGNLGTIHKNGSKISWNNIYKSDIYFKNVNPSLFNTDKADISKLPMNTNQNWIIWTLIISIISILLIIYKNFSL